jgi:hypothetical protein
MNYGLYFVLGISLSLSPPPLVHFLVKSDELWPLFCYRNPLHMWKLFSQVKRKENLRLGQNDDQVGKLLGQKMVDEIGSIFPN